MWERLVENRAMGYGPLRSVFPLLPLLKPVGQAWRSVGWICVRIEGRQNSLWEVIGGLVAVLWTSAGFRRLGWTGVGLVVEGSSWPASTSTSFLGPLLHLSGMC